MGIDDVLGKIQDWGQTANRWLVPEDLRPEPWLARRDGEWYSPALERKSSFYEQGWAKVGEPGPPREQAGMPLALEHTLAGWHWLYSNAVSQPIATFELATRNWTGLTPPDNVFDPKNWSQSWKAAEHISVGQSLLLDEQELERALESPLLYYKPAESYLPPGFNDLPEDEQQRLLREAGMPVVGNAFIEKQRGNSAWFKYASGALDFGSIMFLDPVGLAGKTITSTGRAAQIVKRPKGGWGTEDIDKILSSSKMNRLMEGVWANRANPNLLNNTALARRSGMGPRFGAIVSTLQTPRELEAFMRVGMGDVRAIEEMGVLNAAAKERMNSVTSRVSQMELMYSRYIDNPRMQQIIDVELNKAARAKQADAVLVNRYNEILRQRDLLDELNVSRWSLERAEARTEAQLAYRAGPARGAVSALTRGGVGRATTIRPGVPAIGPSRRQPGEAAFGFTPESRLAPTPIDTGYVQTRLWGVSDFFSTPVTVIRALKNAHPNGYIRLDTIDDTSMRELGAHLARIPGIATKDRQDILNNYLKTVDEGQRKNILEEVGRLGAAKVAERYGLEAEYGMEIYRQHMKRYTGEVDRMQRFSAARRSPEETAALREREGLDPKPYETDPLAYVDTFVDSSGAVKLEPFTVTRLMNGHVFQDLDSMGKVLARHSSSLKAIRARSGNVRDAVENSLDYFSYIWKFSTLFRLGYIPRVLFDDLASQVAKLGVVAMAMRTGKGLKNWSTNRIRTAARPAVMDRMNMTRAGIEYADEEIKILQRDMRPLKARVGAIEASNERELALAFRRHQRAQQKLSGLDPTDLSPKAHALRTFARQQEQQLRQAEARLVAGASPGKKAALQRMQDQMEHLDRYRGLSHRALKDYEEQLTKVRQGNQPITIDGQRFPAAFGGKDGEYYLAQISADDTVGNLFNTNKQLMQGNFERSFDHGAKPVSATQDAVEHLKAWTHAINNQIMQDPMQRLMVAGRLNTVEDAVKWMRERPEGIAYRERLPKMIQTEDIARSARTEIDQYLHTPEVRMKALEPDGVSPSWLDKAVPHIVDRPDVHIGQVGQAQLRHANALDRGIQKWFRHAAVLPSEIMSRHPLYNQLYEGHLKIITASRRKQGQTGPFTVNEVEEMATSARQLSLRDTRKLVFDIAHRSDVASALRFSSPFFSATAESFQRWGRILADKPQVAGYAAAWYNAPLSLGVVQDLDGNTVRPDGRAFDPVTGQWKMTPKSDRYIVTRVPKWFRDSPLGAAFNVQEADGDLKLSQNSINLVTQGDPFFNPGVGPVVQIPVNEFVKDKPKLAELAREMGVLPFGPARGETFMERAVQTVSPKMIKDALTAYDLSDERYQLIKMQITQRAIYEHEELGKPMPSPEEIADRVKNYWKFSAVTAFLQPFATQRKDPYQFYRDQYNNLRRQDAMTADDKFLQRYGESYFIFAQSTSRSGGIPPTQKAFELSKKYARQISRNPELAALIIGPEGDGPFSPEVYTYQLNNPLVPGGAEMSRSRMTADEALKENQRRLGWAKYTKKMNELTAQLQDAGFTSFDDPGAEEFKADRSAWTKLYSEPLMPDGTENPYYNEEWSKDFLTFDVRKYDRLIPGLTQVARSDLAKQPNRSDLRVLQEYLGARQAVVEELGARKRAGLESTLEARANLDLKHQWTRFVGSLIERDTRFGDLYHRYLSRDLGVGVEEELE